MSELENELKQLIIDSLDLEDIEASDIESEEPLFVTGLGLDSIDALELGLAISKQYGVKLEANSEETKKTFASVKSLAAYIDQHRS
ncbi:MAG: acyl carrier protein [Kangiellaceae bacterium]|nr:acyl carrier protein [Kangiellaceae bacterium]|tara:strand:+ start:240 stop:497 length:258 start_codon:yes stop_codon:yes gene_type:complete